LAQDDVVALINAKEKLVAHRHVVVERLAEGWKPWSMHDVHMLVQISDAITVLDEVRRGQQSNRQHDDPERPGSCRADQAPLSAAHARDDC